MSEELVASDVAVGSAEEKKMQAFVMSPEQWQGLSAVLAACPAGLSGEALAWMKSQKPVELNVKEK